MRAPKARAEKNHMIMTYQEKAENTNDTQVDPPPKMLKILLQNSIDLEDHKFRLKKGGKGGKGGKKRSLK